MSSATVTSMKSTGFQTLQLPDCNQTKSISRPVSLAMTSQAAAAKSTSARAKASTNTTQKLASGRQNLMQNSISQVPSKALHLKTSDKKGLQRRKSLIAINQ